LQAKKKVISIQNNSASNKYSFSISSHVSQHHPLVFMLVYFMAQKEKSLPFSLRAASGKC